MSSEGARPAGRRPFVECWPNGPFARCEPSASAASALRKPDFTPPGPQQFSLVHSVRLSHDGRPMSPTARTAPSSMRRVRVLMGGSGAVVALSAPLLRRLDEFGWKQEPS